jgi:catechol 2,3-dioxygenase-like lactoylglutathione lyase family enzyme
MTVKLEHVGISVSDLNQSIVFYSLGFGLTVTEQAEFGGSKYEAILALRGASGRVAVLRTDHLQIELFEFATPLGRPADRARPVCDHGITHFCVQVIDIDHYYKRLSAAGAVFHSPPLEFENSLRATYGRDPDGNVFELLEVIGGQAPR